MAIRAGIRLSTIVQSSRTPCPDTRTYPDSLSCCPACSLRDRRTRPADQAAQTRSRARMKLSVVFSETDSIAAAATSGSDSAAASLLTRLLRLCRASEISALSMLRCVSRAARPSPRTAKVVFSRIAHPIRKGMSPISRSPIAASHATPPNNTGTDTAMTCAN